MSPEELGTQFANCIKYELVKHNKEIQEQAELLTLERVATVLKTALSMNAMAEVIGSLLGYWEDDDILDEERKVGAMLFDLLTEANPEATELAQQGCRGLV